MLKRPRGLFGKAQCPRNAGEDTNSTTLAGVRVEREEQQFTATLCRALGQEKERLGDRSWQTAKPLDYLVESRLHGLQTLGRQGGLCLQPAEGLRQQITGVRDGSPVRCTGCSFGPPVLKSWAAGHPRRRQRWRPRAAGPGAKAAGPDRGIRTTTPTGPATRASRRIEDGQPIPRRAQVPKCRGQRRHRPRAQGRDPRPAPRSPRCGRGHQPGPRSGAGCRRHRRCCRAGGLPAAHRPPPGRRGDPPPRTSPCRACGPPSRPALKAPSLVSRGPSGTPLSTSSRRDRMRRGLTSIRPRSSSAPHRAPRRYSLRCADSPPSEAPAKAGTPYSSAPLPRRAPVKCEGGPAADSSSRRGSA
jgi:hypothetical protein